MVVDAYYNVYILHGTSVPFRLERVYFVLYIIYTLVGVGMSSCFLSLKLQVSEYLNVQGCNRSEDSYANIFWMDKAYFINICFREFGRT